MNEPFQLKLLRQQADLRARLRDAQDVRKVLTYGLRVARDLLEAREGAIATLKPGRKKAHVVYTRPRREWDEKLLTRFVLGERPSFPETMLLAPIKRRGRHWAVLALSRAESSFELYERDALYALTQSLTTIVQRLDDKRSRKVRRKIERKIAEHQEPKDLIYDLLHGLRSLTRYDHSASLLVARQGADSLELVAEQIAWTKARSRRIGLRIDLDETLRGELEVPAVRRFERAGGGDGWRDPRGEPASLPEILEAGPLHGAPAAVAMLCAPIATPEGVLAVLKVCARRGGVLGDWEARRVEEFLPLASLSVQFSVRTESLQEQVLRSERKHALANLTRGIAHDVNNALGAMLPLVQQMREDARRGDLDAATLDGDLASLESSLQTCRRIFGGMLAIARGSGPGVGHGNLRRAIDGTLSVLGDSLSRRSIDVVVELPRELPAIRGSQGDLTQLFLNLCANARDAMPEGGELRITGENGHSRVKVTVEDSGSGIPASILGRISEPFFTTKAEGNGLGLSICRSILWDIGGEMKIDSAPGEGTRVRLALPVLEDETGPVPVADARGSAR